MKPRLLSFTAFVALAAALSLSAQTAPSDTSFGIDLAGMDRSVRPQDDFFRFVNGKWDDATPIPPDMPSYGTFAILRDRAAAAVRGILDEASAGTPAAGTVAQKVGGFYRSFMDEPRIESLALRPLEGELAAINAVSSAEGLTTAFVRAAKTGGRSPMAVTVGQDPKQSDLSLIHI